MFILLPTGLNVAKNQQTEFFSSVILKLREKTRIHTDRSWREDRSERPFRTKGEGKVLHSRTGERPPTLCAVLKHPDPGFDRYSASHVLILGRWNCDIIRRKDFG
ncbi:hypothetical protein TNCV_835681 [Trichonephila clavipes]|nr:hypothetical protein TNCV_835681 [Trichonephila clavipes]